VGIARGRGSGRNRAKGFITLVEAVYFCNFRRHFLAQCNRVRADFGRVAPRNGLLSTPRCTAICPQGMR
jgi:hypothetical protein